MHRDYAWEGLQQHYYAVCQKICNLLLTLTTSSSGVSMQWSNGQVSVCLSCVMSTAAALTHICHRRQSAAVSTQRQCCNPRRKDAGFFIEWLSKLTHSNDFWDTLNPEKIGINILRKCALLTCKMWPLSLICLTCLWQTTHHCTACTSCN